MAALTDEEVHRIAKARVGFKSHLAVYVLVNLLLAAIWFTTSGVVLMGWGTMGSGTGYYWPVWTHLGWGLGLALHGFFAMGPGQGMQAREEQRVRERFGRT